MVLARELAPLNPLTHEKENMENKASIKIKCINKGAKYLKA